MSDKAGDGVGGERVFTAEQFSKAADMDASEGGFNASLLRQAARQARVLEGLREWLTPGNTEQSSVPLLYSRRVLAEFDRLMAEEAR